MKIINKLLRERTRILTIIDILEEELLQQTKEKRAKQVMKEILQHQVELFLLNRLLVWVRAERKKENARNR